MNVRNFKQKLDALRDTNSRNDKKDIIRSVQDSPAAISFLSGSEYDDVGLGKKTVHKVAQEALGSFDAKPTVSEGLDKATTQTSQEGKRDLSMLREDMEEIARLSGNEQKHVLSELFRKYDYPSVVAHACLNDWPTGVSDTTVANALGIRDSLPFYDSVVDAAEVPNPIEEPVIHNAFSPMLAKSESSLPEERHNLVAQPKLDGYRLLIHVKSFKRGSPASDTHNVRAFTRRGNDVTESLPELHEIDWPDGKHILDCEAIAETGNYSDTSERIGRKEENVSREVEMEFGLFDVIVFDGEQVHEQPYRKRHGLTRAVADFTPDERVSALPVYRDETKAKEVSSEYEGLIWKDPKAAYEFGKRSKSWVKQKHQSENVDVRISGIVEGEGRLDGSMGKLSIESAEGEDVGNVGTGFSDKQRDEIWQNKDEWVGEVIEVEAEAYDSSLRFPRYKRDRRDDGSADSIEKIQSVMPEA